MFKNKKQGFFSLIPDLFESCCLLNDNKQQLFSEFTQQTRKKTTWINGIVPLKQKGPNVK